MNTEWTISLPLIVFALLLLLFLRVPIGIALGLVGFFGMYFLAGPALAMNAISQLFLTVPVNFILLAIPLFVLMAEIIIFTGMANEAYKAMDSLFSGMPGGLALGTVAAGVVFGAVTGSSIASSATIGPVAVREMVGRGYKKSLASGVIACAGGLAILIPPSIPLIVFGYLAEISVTKLFMAGIMPGLVLAVSYAAVIIVWTRADASAAPSIQRVASVSERLMPMFKLWPFIVLAIIVLGSIYMGVATPTEAASVGVFGSVILAFVFRKFNLKSFYAALLSTAKTTGFVMFILVGALIFTFLLNYLSIPTLVTSAILGYNVQPVALIAGIMLIMLALGCIIDAMSLLIVATSVFLPSLLAAGFNPVLIGILFTLNCEMAIVTPPVAMNLFVAHAIGKPYGVTFGDVTRGIMPFLVGDVATIILMVAFPMVPLWIPQRLA